jgi:hypothetical protein
LRYIIQRIADKLSGHQPAELARTVALGSQRRQRARGGVPAEYFAAVKAGDQAEIAFGAVPARVFNGKVRQVLDAIAAGQPRGTLEGH